MQTNKDVSFAGIGDCSRLTIIAVLLAAILLSGGTVFAAFYFTEKKEHHPVVICSEQQQIGAQTKATCELESDQQFPSGVQCAVNAPTLVSAKWVTLPDNVTVFGIVLNGQARAYLAKTMACISHHVVNDQIGKAPVSMTYCDRDKSVRAFTASQGGLLELDLAGYHGSEGMLLRANGIVYAQRSGRTLNGKNSLPFTEIPVAHTDWKTWKTSHPNTLIYFDQLTTSANSHVCVASNLRLAAHEKVIGVTVGDDSRAYLVRDFRELTKYVVHDRIGGSALAITYCPKKHRVKVFGGAMPNKDMDIAFAGWEAHGRENEMILRAQGNLYFQSTLKPIGTSSAAPFPFAEVSSVRTTWKQWRERHPQSKVVVLEEWDDLMPLFVAKSNSSLYGLMPIYTALLDLWPLAAIAAVLLILVRARRFI